MWLHIPPQCFPSVPVGVDLKLGCPWPGSGSPGEYDPELFVMLNGKPTPQPVSWRPWKRRSWIRHLYGIISRPLTADLGAAKWISSLLDSPVSRCRAPGNGRARQMSVGSGQTLPGSLARWDPASSSWKTCQAFMFTDSEKFSGPWPVSGMMRNGIVFQRPQLVHRTLENGCSSWATPAANTTKGMNKNNIEFRKGKLYSKFSGQPIQTALTQQVKLWSTPAARDHRSGKASDKTLFGNARPLNEAATAWATPHTSASTGAGTQGRKGGMNLQTQARYSPYRQTPRAGRKSHHRLNPLFVENLMGWPTGLSSCLCSETGWCHYRRLMLSALYGLI